MQATFEMLKIAYFLAKRDIQSTYARSALGIVWLVLRPLVLLSVYSLVYGRVLRLGWSDPGNGTDLGFIAPFFCGILPYLTFSEVVFGAMSSILSKRSMIGSTNIPMSAYVWSTLIRSVVSSVIQTLLLIMFILYMGYFNVNTLWVIALGNILLFALLIPLAFSIAMLAPFFSDLSEILRVIVRFSFYLAPIAYPINLVDSEYRILLYANPLSFIVEFFRNSVYSTFHGPPLEAFYFYAFFCCLFFGISVLFVKKLSGVIVDVL